MAINLWIPRIEFNDVPIVGDITNGSDIIDNIDDTSPLSEGMYVTGSGIPADTTIIAVLTNSVQMSANAAATATDADFDFFKRFDFQFPPAKDADVTYKPNNTVIDSLSGKRQVQTNFIEATRQLEHWFIKKADSDVLENEFYLAWASLGCKFRYFPDMDDDFYLNASLDKPHGFDKSRQIKKHPDFLYKLPMTIRYTVSLPANVGGVILTEGGDTITTEDGDSISL